MKTLNHFRTLSAWLCAAKLLLASTGTTLAAVHYVDVSSTNATPPYTNWATAATTIQAAVDAAVGGDEVVVTNGIYASGGRVVSGTLANRVVVDKPLALRSINGPQFTVIQGHQVPGLTNSYGAIRCVYLAAGASLSGFTLTNGATTGENDYPTYSQNSGGGLRCDPGSWAVVSNCVVAGNSATYGGGASGGTLYNCTLTGNSGFYGGGAAGSILNNCTLTGNSAEYGGGASAWAGYATGGTLNNCRLTGNSADSFGGGAYEGTLNNCVLSGNSSRSDAGGAYGCTLNNCTLTGNSASHVGGASGGYYDPCTLNNCIIYFNTAPQEPNYGTNSYTTLNYCCTTPRPIVGVNNISQDPQLASSSHLSAGSPCRGAGNAAYAGGTDIDGEAWASPPSIGCDEYHSGAVTGAMAVAITAPVTNATIGFTLQFTALIQGRTTSSTWDFGDGTTATNRPYISHAWAALGDYAVVLRAYNESQPDGISATVTVHVVNDVHYVASNSPNPVRPYSTWATAATNIQDAIGSAIDVGAQVVVTNGIYAPIAALNLLTVRSVNGPLVTIIDGGQSNQCASLGTNTTLTGFTLTHGFSSFGGGASGGILSNCTLTGNSAGYSGGGASSSTLNTCTLSSNSASYGGGASGGTLNNCTLRGNSATVGGGGVYQATLNSCALSGNSAPYGGGASGGYYPCILNNCTLSGNSGGASSSTLNNCIVYFNLGQNYDSSDTLNYCCTTPQPTNGVGNISLDPQLVSASHLSAGSPCHGAGNATYASGTDIDGEPWATPPSIGCDEYHTGAVTGPLSVGISASFTNVLTGYAVQLTALIEGRATSSVWYFGDGATATNQPYTSHAWTALGDYAVVLRAYNESQPGGISATVTVHVITQPIHYVAVGSLNTVAPYTSWTTAATNIQDAMGAATVPGALVLVTNGVYAPIAGSKLLTVRSVNGPLLTVINGGGSNQCASLGTNLTLTGFTLTNGAVGAVGGTLNNCVLSGNSGSGASNATLNNCALTDNSGTGAYRCMLNNCTLTGNSGGGASNCTLNNCIAYFNTAQQGANYDSFSILSYCCATPLPPGIGNISVNPQLTDSAHLSADSPCVPAGSSAFTQGVDIDGEAWASPPSIGCDEFHPGSVTGPLTLSIAADYTNVAAGFAVNFTAQINGHATLNLWDFGDGTFATNQAAGLRHSFASVGDYTVKLWTYNDSYPAGLSATLIIHVKNGLHYVSAASLSPVAPYASWATAATNIQAAVAAAAPGATILVTNGYYFGGVQVYAPLSLRSVNGPQVTSINGGGSVRCVYLANGASLSGFTLTSGFALDVGGGVMCESTSVIVSNCVIIGNRVSGSVDGDFYGGGAYGGTLNNCTLTANSASATIPNYGGNNAYAWGGGAAYCTLINCTLSGNWASANNYDTYGYSVAEAYGGGAAYCTLTNCTLSGNSVGGSGYGTQTQYGGAYDCTLDNCTLTGNSRVGAGGCFLNNCTVTTNSEGGAFGTLNNCTVTGNSGLGASGSLSNCIVIGNSSGGASGTLNNCAVTGNSSWGASGTLNNCTVAANLGWGASGTLNNCAVTGNSGGGASGTLNNCAVTGNSGCGNSGASGMLNNCIVYFNEGSNYVSSSTLNYCCTVPLPTNGVGNISLDPQLASASHLSAGSPCRGAGNAAYASGTDIDGEPWGSPPSIGCDEYHAGALTGPLTVGITATFTNVSMGFAVQLTALIGGRATASIWDFGDGLNATNQPYTSHAWAAPGDYAVVLRVYNESHPGGISATLTVHVVAGVHYVAANGSSPVAPYTSWATAATNMQDAIAVAVEPGANVLVTNGTYAPIAAFKLLTVRSVNGPLVTVIDGGQSNQCATLGTNTILNGFTLSHGVSYFGGGASGGILSNCTLTANSASYGGGASYSTLNNCTLTSNSAAYGGGGAYQATLNNCSLSGNSASYAGGGGAYQATLNTCTLNSNSAASSGGGAAYSTLNTCTSSDNYPDGANGSTLNNCTLSRNSGDGASSCTLNGCALIGNLGPGAYSCLMTNCTLTGNAYAGASSSTLNNCIVYFNQGQNYDSSDSLNYCCTTPQPLNGAGNISVDPQLASPFHLSAASPCRGAGNAAYARGTDIDGEPWASPPSIGCDEYHDGGVTGPLSVGITASLTNVLAGYAVQLTALIEGRTTASIWAFGDGTTATNQPYTSHAWTALGDYAVVLRAYNQSQPGGISATVTIHVVAQPVHYVAVDSANPVAPYTSWATAATNIQDAVDAATVPGALVQVTNGIYATGGRLVYSTTNRVAAYKLLTVRSVNGRQFTLIDGGQSFQCVYLTNGATLSGFTLTNGASGVYCESTTAEVSNCVVTANLGDGAHGGTLNNCTLSSNLGNGALFAALNNCTLIGNSGAGAYGSTLNNCAVSGNLGGSYGTGAYASSLTNCTLSGNFGGGAAFSTLNNCILYFNTANQGANYDSYSTLNYCCTTPQPTNGLGNISLDPQLASAWHLSAASPCRGAGNAAYMTGTDIDGESWANPPSIGCDEYHAGVVTGPLSVGITASFTNVVVGLTVQLAAVIEGRATGNSWDFGDGITATNQPYTSHAWTVPGDYAVVLRAYNESQPGGISATVTVHVVVGVHYVAANSSSPMAPYTSWATAATSIQDAIAAAVESGAQVVVSNGTYGPIIVPNLMTVRSVHGPFVTTINGGYSNQCASLATNATLTGFTLSSGVSTNGGGAAGGTLNNCTLQGNSADSGGGAYNCTLNNCTLTGNSTPDDYGAGGGGAFSCTLNNCTLTGNSTSGEFGGGGAYYCTLSNCTLTGNSAFPCRYCYAQRSDGGGGASYSTLINCTLSGNSSSGFYGGQGGGASGSRLFNCIVTGNSALGGYGIGGGANSSYLYNCTVTGNSANYDNSAGVYSSTLVNCILYYNNGPNYNDYYSSLSYCCTTPQPTYGGIGIITAPPIFVDQAGGNLRLKSNSPCINAGANFSVTTSTDLDGNPRIAGGTVDIGAYEFQAPVSRISYAWLQHYGLPIDSNTDSSDADGDGMNNWQEWIAGTDPTDAASLLRLLSPVPTPPRLLLSWNGEANHFYFVERTTSLTPPLTFSVLGTNMPGLSGMTTFTDTTPPATGAALYRIGTDSTNASSPLWLQAPILVPGSVTVSWTSVSGRNYFLERTTGLMAPGFTSVAANIPGQSGTTSYTDTNAVGAGPFFYRVGVQN